MKVYNVGFIPQITHTHNPRRALGVVCQQVNLPELHTKGIQDIMDEFVSAILHPVRDIEDSTLNRMYKSLRVGEERKLENFDGLRKISAYKGDAYMNKIVQELSDPPVTFIRSMKNIGTNEDPRVKTTAMSIRIPTRMEEIIVEMLEDNPENPLFLRVTREGFEAHKALYKSWDEMKQDSVLQRIAKVITGQEFK